MRTTLVIIFWLFSASVIAQSRTEIIKHINSSYPASKAMLELMVDNGRIRDVHRLNSADKTKFCKLRSVIKKNGIVFFNKYGMLTLPESDVLYRKSEIILAAGSWNFSKL